MRRSNSPRSVALLDADALIGRDVEQPGEFADRQRNFPALPFFVRIVGQGDGGRKRLGTNRPQSTRVTVPGLQSSTACAMLSTCGFIVGQWFVLSRRVAKGGRLSCCSRSIHLSFVMNASKPDRSIRSRSFPFLIELHPSRFMVETS